MPDREDFPKKVKEMLAKRVGWRCSQPACGQLTSGPHTNRDRTVNIGVAAHIVAAASKGPRADDPLSPGDRKSIDNGIWLCQSCSKLIDSDTSRYTVGVLRRWKESAERRAADELERGRIIGLDSELETLKVYRAYFDRPALQDAMNRCGSYSDFVAALTQLIELLNTGRVRGEQRARSRHQLGKTKELVGVVYHAVRTLRGRYLELRRGGVIDEAQCMCNFRDPCERGAFENLKGAATNAFNAVTAPLHSSRIARPWGSPLPAHRPITVVCFPNPVSPNPVCGQRHA